MGSDGSDGDAYAKLRPAGPTPNDALCACSSLPAIVLQPRLSANPLACFACYLEVAPERLALSAEAVQSVAFWQSFHDCFYRLWLDSSEFEQWARSELENPNSVVHTRGLKLVSELQQYRRAYYWWFQDTGHEGFVPLDHCPRCLARLTSRLGKAVCEPCSIVVEN
jgi:hypothetical protein